MDGLKIRVSGPSGGGQTYFSQKLSALTRIPVTSLDNLRYDFSTTHRFENKRSFADFNVLLAGVLAKPSWIIEGGYLGGSRHTIDAAELVFYVSPAPSKRLLNTVRRFVARMRESKYEGMHNFLSLSWYNLSSIKKWKQHEKDFEKQGHLVFRSADEAYDYFVKYLVGAGAY